MFNKKRIKMILGSILLLAGPGNILFAQNSSAISMYNEAYALQDREDFYGAIEKYTEVLKINPQYGDAWLNLAMCSFNLGEFDLAVEYADKASVYLKNRSDLENLRGLAYISLGRLDEARAVFDNILTIYPNDVDARFGLAELDIFSGSLSSAENRYLEALKRDTKNRKTLLSLALVSAELGKNDIAQKYINQALQFHSGEPEVHYLAAYLAAKRGNLKEAESRARSAVQIKSDYDKAYELLSDILFAQKRYDEVIDICDFRLGRNRTLSTAWYLKGLAQTRLNRKSEAINSYTVGLTVDPQDEVMRYALEQLIDETLPIEDGRRAVWAKYHIDKAVEYNRNYDGPSERFEYQTALGVDPLNLTARQAFASLLERDGFYELYLYQLQFIKNNISYPKATSDVIQQNENTVTAKKSAWEIKNDDTIEALQSLMASNLSNKWNVKPFYLDKTRWNIGVYYVENPVQFVHASVEQLMAVSTKDMFDGVASTAVQVHSQPVSGFGEAFRLSRSSGLDYFIILNVEETERSFCIKADVYSARTGTQTTTINVYRTGNDRVAKSLRRLRQAVMDILPIRGTVLDNSQGTLLVDLGYADNITAGAEFDVVKKGCISTADKGIGLTYKTKDIIGTFTADKVNEEISEGSFVKKGFYDTLNVGDEVVLVKSGESSLLTNGSVVTDTRPAADSNGKPATLSAAKAENDSLAEVIKERQQESSLLRLIQSIL